MVRIRLGLVTVSRRALGARPPRRGAVERLAAARARSGPTCPKPLCFVRHGQVAHSHSRVESRSRVESLSVDLAWTSTLTDMVTHKILRATKLTALPSSTRQPFKALGLA
jgi:hypothetical protein